MTPSPRVSVVIPHYNDLRGLDLCLAALAVQTYRGGEVVTAPFAGKRIDAHDHFAALWPGCEDAGEACPRRWR